MDIDNIISVIVAILTGLATCIPLTIKLVQYVQAATRAKNWPNLIGLVMNLMEDAEQQFEDGATRKAWVLEMTKSSAEYINYPVDTAALSNMIDALCKMAKGVNRETTDKNESTGG